MSQSFDPYFKWLGIPSAEQPPNHYRLLGIPEFTDDPDVIENAADQRMGHVRTFGSGQYSDHSQRLLNEISAAKVILLDQEKKASYDTKINSEVALEGPKPTRPTPPVANKPPSRAQPSEPKPVPAGVPVWIIATIAGVVAAGLCVIVGGAALLFWRNEAPPVARKDSHSNPPVAATPTGNETDESDKVKTEADSDSNSNNADSSDVPASQSTDGEESAINNVTEREGEDHLIAAAGTEAEITQLTSVEVAKASVPDAEARNAAEEKVTTVFGDQITQATTSAEKRAVAFEMIQIAGQTEQLPIRFVLLQKAIEIGKEIGDADVAFDAVNRLDASFEGDALRLKASVLHGITAKLGRGKEHIGLAVRFASTINEAIDENRFDIAQPLTEVALQSAIKSGDVDLRKRAVGRVKDVETLAKSFDEVKTALATLQSSPTDAQANLIAGKYYCFVRGDWREGLPYLALASDAQLKALAEQELEDSPDAMELGNGWWDIAVTLPELQASRVQLRAAQHYRRALPTLKGFDKVTVEKRLGDLPDTPPLEIAPREKIVDLIALSDPARHGEKGRWKKSDRALVVTNLQDASFFNPPYQPPREYDLQVSLTRTRNGPTGASDTHVRIPRGSNCHTFGIRMGKDGSTQLSFWGDKAFGKPPMGVTIRRGIALGAKHTLLFRVRDAGVTVSVDGRDLFMVDDYSILRSSDDGIGLGSYQNQTVFHEMIVREILSPRTGGSDVIDLLAQADVRRDASVVEHAEWQRDDGLQPVVLDDPAADVALALARITGEEGTAVVDLGDPAPELGPLLHLAKHVRQEEHLAVARSR